MLVVNNLQLPVSNNMTVYQSVINSSKLALNAMEKVLKGESHRVQSGALLLGLSAWHLYPDMVVHGTVTKEIRQNDDLFPIGSLISLGLESDEGIDQGVFWSIPLAHLRYYGDPVKSSRCTGHDAARISVDQLVYVALGALLSTWVEDIQEMSIVLQWFRKLSHCIDQAATMTEQNACSSSQIRTFLRGPGWLRVLMDAAIAFDGLAERNKELPAKLMALGHRRFNSFLAEPQYRLDPFFGLIAPEALFPLLKRDEDRIGILRRVSANLGLNEEVIIRYRHSSFQTQTDVKVVDGKEQKYVYYVQVTTYEYASAFPLPINSTKRARSGRKVESRRHKRWISMTWDVNTEDLGPVLRSERHTFCFCTNDCTSNCPCSQFDDGCLDGCCCLKGARCFVTKSANSLHKIQLDERGAEIQALGEDYVETRPRSFIELFRPSIQAKKITPRSYPKEIQELRYNYPTTWTKDHESEHIAIDHAPWADRKYTWPFPASLEFLYGDVDSAALYRVLPCQGTTSHPAKISIKNEIISEELHGLLDTNSLDILALTRCLASLQNGPQARCISSLKALASIVQIYRLLPDATISLKIASRPLHNSLWVKCERDEGEACGTGARDYLRGVVRNLGTETELKKKNIVNTFNPWLFELSLQRTFACIAMLESGEYDIDPVTLEHVFAMSSGNSIFVSAALLSDPGEMPEVYEVRRVVGNIGRAGIAMPIPPQDPRIRKPDIESWHLINHAPFDHQRTDSFQNTSLHLSFTQYTMPFNIGDHGAQDAEAFFIESLISVHDRGRWVADLDVLSMFRSVDFKKVAVLKHCDHSESTPSPHTLISIDNWEELLDRGNASVVVRASRNPMARLATAVVSVKQGYQTIVIPESVKDCWVCITQWQMKPTTYIF